MSVNLEVKGSLARLLATENVVVEHRNVDTASFDVNRRVLTLPMWEYATNNVYDLLVGHEVGHALFTPNYDLLEWQKIVGEIPSAFINVVEDARVERLMKKKYPGISKSFFAGYSELNEKDFFSTKNKDIDKLSFVDRINLYFKVGAFLNITFDDQEDEFITRISKSQTFEEVLEICRDLVKYLKVKKINISTTPQKSNGANGERPDEKTEGVQIISDNGYNSDYSDSDSNDLSDSDSDDSDSDSDESEPSNANSGIDEFNPITDQSFKEKSKNLINKSANPPMYVELPEFDLNTLILPISEIHRKLNSFYGIDGSYYTFSKNRVSDIRATEQSYFQYKKDSQKEVSYMVKEFECKKAADQHSRNFIAKTGLLNTSKLYSYKYSEDIFKKISVVADGKSHGLMFILDWSGSMGNILMDTCKQLYSLIWFCKKCQIPFDVYAFVEHPNCYVDFQKHHPFTYERKENIIEPNKSFRLMHFFTSKVSTTVLEAQMQNIWKVCNFLSSGSSFAYPKFAGLGSTPLGESIMALHQLIPHFSNKTKVQKTHVVFLTDGDGNSCASLVKSNSSHKDFMTAYPSQLVVRNKKNGRQYPAFDSNYYGMEKVILSTVKDAFPDVNLVNFRIGHVYNSILEHHEEKNVSKATSFFNVNGYVTLTNGKYDQFHIIRPSTIRQHERWQVSGDSDMKKINDSFKNYMRAKKTNTKLISSFMSLIG